MTLYCQIRPFLTTATILLRETSSLRSSCCFRSRNWRKRKPSTEIEILIRSLYDHFHRSACYSLLYVVLCPVKGKPTNLTFFFPSFPLFHGPTLPWVMRSIFPRTTNFTALNRLEKWLFLRTSLINLCFFERKVRDCFPSFFSYILKWHHFLLPFSCLIECAWPWEEELRKPRYSSELLQVCELAPVSYQTRYQICIGGAWTEYVA